MGYHVLVGNPRKLRVIRDSNEKSDTRDAQMLARIDRFDPDLLYPVNHIYGGYWLVQPNTFLGRLARTAI